MLMTFIADRGARLVPRHLPIAPRQHVRHHLAAPGSAGFQTSGVWQMKVPGYPATVDARIVATIRPSPTDRMESASSQTSGL